jgi:hypothetical protein
VGRTLFSGNNVFKVSLSTVTPLTIMDAPFFAGWITRFGNPPGLFCIPLEQDKAPEPLGPTNIK